MQNHTPFVSSLDGAVPPNWNVSQHFIAENTISTCSSMLVLLSVFLSCIQQYSTPAKIKNNHKIGDLSHGGYLRFIQADEPPVEGSKAAPLLKSVDEVHGISNANEDVPKNLAKKLEMGLSENEGYTMDIPGDFFFGRSWVTNGFRVTILKPICATMKTCWISMRYHRYDKPLDLLAPRGDRWLLLLPMLLRKLGFGRCGCWAGFARCDFLIHAMSAFGWFSLQ